MRDIFDQYEHPENRLTHALVWCLAEDPRLLRRFIRWTTGAASPPSKNLHILEQSVPKGTGAPAPVMREGLPDAWIHDGNGWSLIIESKVAARLSADQLRRQLRTAQRQGFDRVTQLAITVTGRPVTDRPGIKVIRWADLYRWCRREAGASKWAARLASYLEVAETRMLDSRYLRDGALTAFAGIPFDEDNRYAYPEAKRVLALIMEELREREDLRRALPIRRAAAGRPAITGRAGASVWDTLPLRIAPKGASFTRYPHLDIAIRTDGALAVVVFPGSMKASIRRNLLGLGRDSFGQLMQDTARRLSRALPSGSGAVPWAEVVQRRYPSRRAVPIVDARLHYDLRAAVEVEPQRGKSPVKLQPQWLDATFGALVDRRSNLQLAVGAVFPYARCSAIRSRKALDLFAATWIACIPMLNVALGKTGKRTSAK